MIRAPAAQAKNTSVAAPHFEPASMPSSVGAYSEGAGLVKFDGDEVLVEWVIEWVTAGIYDANLTAPANCTPLPLFPDLDQLAA